MSERHYHAGEGYSLKNRFRGYLPVVVDVETGGFNPGTDALLEVCAVLVEQDERGQLALGQAYSTHVQPFEGANLDPKSLRVNGIDPWHPLRAARKEADALEFLFKPIRAAVKAHGCTRAILVGHNAHFDLSFINAAVERSGVKRNPFHLFSSFDTVSLSGLVYGQTVLARAAHAAGIAWDASEAHSAVYDTKQTARLFCQIVNRWESLHLNNGD